MNQAQQIKQELNGETTVTLKYPVKLATGQTLNKVAVRRPRVGDLRAVMHISNEAEQGLMLVSRVTGLVPEDLDMLDLKDLEAIQATFRSEDESGTSQSATVEERIIGGVRRYGVVVWLERTRNLRFAIRRICRLAG